MYFPNIIALRSKTAYNTPPDAPDIPVYSIELWLPSSIGRLLPWDHTLGDYEWQLRKAQACDALDSLRQNLRMRDFLLKKKKDWARGVRENTRSQTLINQTISKIASSATKYRVARAALKKLAPILGKEDTWDTEFRVLKEDEIQGLPAEGWGEGRRSLSWIWMAAEASVSSESDQPRLNDSMFIAYLLIVLTY
jgi:hypothetical protein